MLSAMALVCCSLAIDTSDLSSGPDGSSARAAADENVQSNDGGSPHAEAGSVVRGDGESGGDALLDGSNDATATDASVPDADASTDAPADARAEADAPSSLDCTGKPGPAMVAVPLGSGYCIDSTEVTRSQYADFLGTAPSVSAQTPECAWNASYVPTVDWPYAQWQEKYPVVGVDWCDANAYCKSVGKRLCGAVGGGSVPPSQIDTSTSQWWMACSRGGLRQYPYSVGSPDPNACISSDNTLGGAAASVGRLSTCEGGYSGIFDMSGNVAEWEDSCDSASGAFDTTSCRARGGNFDMQAFNDNCGFHPGFSLYPRSTMSYSVGFRCCSP